MSSSAQQPALSRPAQAAAILRSLPGLADRLRASPPPTAEELQQLKSRLEAIKPLIKDGTAAPALLSNAAARTALLSVLAVAIRQPLAGSAGAQGSSAGREERRLLLRYISIACWAYSCCTSLLRCNLPLLHAERQLGFALRLVRTQPLQCWARRLAEVGPELLSLHRGLQQGEGGPQEGPRGSAASGGAARARDRQLFVVSAASDMLSQSLHSVEALISLALPVNGQGDAPPPHSELGQELAGALRDSCVLEHAARTLLLLLPLQRLQPAGGDDDSDNFRHAQALALTINRMAWVALCSAPMGDGIATATTSEPSTLAEAALHELLWASGRCLQHAVLVLGLAALCAADGGPSYGLPSELLRHVPVIGRRERPGGEAVDLRHTPGRVVLDSTAFENMAQMLRCGVWAAPPGRQGALALVLRVARLVAASGRAHLGAGGGSAEAEATARHECGSGGGSGSGSGSDGGSAVAVAAAAGEAAVAAAALGDGRSKPQPERAAVRAECWRLFAAYTRDVLPLPLQRGPPCSPVRHLQDPGPMLPGAPLPASPPPSWADALAGGWLPCLERLLRRGGEDPADPESRLAMNALAVCLPDVKPCTLTWRFLAVLLAYGEPGQAAALVVTLGKGLPAADLFALVEPKAAYNRIVAPTFAGALWALGSAHEEWEAASGAAAYEALTAALPAQTAAGRQLALMVSCAACEWLPPLARLAMRAMQLRSVPAAAGAAQDDAPSATLLLPLLGWLPVLAQRCTMAAVGEAAAGGGVAAAVGGAGGAGPADPGGGVSHGPSGGGWLQLLLEEVGAVPLLGAALHMLTGADVAAPANVFASARQRLVRACLAVTVACPREVRAAAARAATGQGVVAAAGTAGVGAPTLRGQGPQPAAEAPAVGAAPLAHAQFPWRPQQLHALAASVRAKGWDAEADGADALAALLQSWEAAGGEDVDSGETPLAGAEAGTKAEAGSRPQKPMGLRAAWQRVEECSALFRNECQVALALVPVAEARGVLRTCSYSG
ncbi:hypothetical protein TSOC_012081 [Tetrabaena socialis]|uniref:Uncharacterized protein n=1 Tax=Tetrabaena socialis TaxID=47790 RepID=A0A2J7ZNZ2_9CHLO|nr:hypothetical protein TSOC_012081 [Tetrabaena socialis]|eukprot:PNH01978.1 hypothetical protein TSOC_012081 [Tetrabaena socialis]